MAQAQPTMSVISNLKFPDRFPNISESVVITPQDSRAAVIRISGGPPNKKATCKVAKSFINMTNQSPGGGGQTMRVASWKLQCPGKFDQAGNMEVRMGATATKRNTNPPGTYTDAPGLQSLTITY